jgi:hypothetical protein
MGAELGPKSGRMSIKPTAPQPDSAYSVDHESGRFRPPQKRRISPSQLEAPPRRGSEEAPKKPSSDFGGCSLDSDLQNPIPAKGFLMNAIDGDMNPQGAKDREQAIEFQES